MCNGRSGLLEEAEFLGVHQRPHDVSEGTLFAPDLDQITINFKNASGYQVRSKTITTPIKKYGKTYVAFCRDTMSPKIMQPGAARGRSMLEADRITAPSR